MELPNSCAELQQAHQIRFNPSSSQYDLQYYAQECFHICVVKVKQCNGTASLQARKMNVMKPKQKRSKLRCRYTTKSEIFLLLCLIIICFSSFRPGFCLFLTLCFLPLLLPPTSYFCLLFKFLLLVFLLSLPCVVLIFLVLPVFVSSLRPCFFFSFLFLLFYLSSFCQSFFFHSKFIQTLPLSFLTPFR